MKKFLKKLIDSRDRQVEAHLVLLCLGALALISMTIYHTVILQHPFDPDAYGQGLGYLLAGGGAAAWGQGLQRKNEKDNNNGPDQ